MKKLFLVALLFSLSVCAFAQQDYVGRYDVFGGFSYLASPKLNLEQRGFNTQIGYNVKRWLALGFDYSIQGGNGTLVPRELKPSLQALLPPIPGLYVPFNATTQTFTAGPQLACRHFKKATFFIHPSIGAIHEHINLEPQKAAPPYNLYGAGVVAGLVGTGVLQTTSPSDHTYFYGLGGGAEYNATKHVHIRADVEFVHVFLFSDLLKDSRNSVRLSVGPTFNFGKNVR
jgi:opacity protein-like surface antigen